MATYNVVSFTSCPDSCDDENLLPAILAEQDCADYAQDHSQVHTVILRPDGATDPFADFATTPTAVSGGIDNTETSNAKSKLLVGEGGIAVPEKIILEFPKLQQRVGERDYSLTFNIKNLSAAQYSFLLKLQCGHVTGWTFYYCSGMGANQWLYGTQGGIPLYFMDVDFPKGGGNTDRDIATLILRWKAKGDPLRRANPL